MRPLRPPLAFLALLLWVAAARFAILFHSQTHVHTDEAIVGLMGKHVLEGRYLPFYMDGQVYNAGAAWEAYLAAAAFAIFGVGVVPLKGCIVALSLVCLVLFYRMARAVDGRRSAFLATVALALSPSLLKWHFQVRGYSAYFLAIPILTGLFFSIDASSSSRARRVFFLGLVSGLSLWSLELGLTLVVAIWTLLALRRRLSWREGALGLGGFLVGYGPAIAFNVTHGFANWRYLIADKVAKTPWGTLLHPSTLVKVFVHELPKFFGTDTVFLYYSETPVLGVVLYVVALVVIAATVAPFVKEPSRIRRALLGDPDEAEGSRRIVVLALGGACLAAYLAAPTRFPAYLLGACFFLAMLTGGLLDRCFGARAVVPRVLGAGLAVVLAVTGGAALVEVGTRNEIETLTLNRAGTAYFLTRVPGADLEGVEDHLKREGIRSVGTTISFVYPLLFESGESLAVSDAMFGPSRRVYPPGIPWREPTLDERAAFVVETGSPFVPAVTSFYARTTGGAPRVTPYGALTVFQAARRGE